MTQLGCSHDKPEPTDESFAIYILSRNLLWKHLPCEMKAHIMKHVRKVNLVNFRLGFDDPFVLFLGTFECALMQQIGHVNSESAAIILSHNFINVNAGRKPLPKLKISKRD